MACRTQIDNEICARFAVAIKARNLTPRATSIKAGFPPAYIGNMLRRGSCPRTGRFTTLCRTLKLSVDWVVTGNGTMFNDEWFRGRIAIKIVDAVEADVTGFERIIAYVRERLAPYEVTDEEFLAAGRMMVALWKEKAAGSNGALPAGGGQ